MKTAILLTAFGTTVARARVALETIEEEYRKTFPEQEIRWAYTSDAVRKIILQRDGIYLDTPATALAKLQDEGYENVLVQSLHIFPGQEYHDLLRTVEAFDGLTTAKGERFIPKLVLGKPLLYEYEDYLEVLEKGLSSFVPENQQEALLLMGHGTEHFAFSSYGCLNEMLKRKYKNVFLATVEGYPSLEEAQADLKIEDFQRIHLLPFMVVAGDHALNDLIGEEEDSWKNILEKAGYQVDYTLKGLGEVLSIVEIFLEHTKKGLKELDI